MTKPHSESNYQVTRREFLKAVTTAAVVGAVLEQPSAFGASSAAGDGSPIVLSASADLNSQRMLTGWDHRRGGLGGPWEVWKKASDNDILSWDPVELPHCFNAYDGVDPDTSYYQGQGWYRTRLKIVNPYPDGRALLHFEGAGQKTAVYVHTTQVGEHVGGYDEFTVDITDAANRELKNPNSKGLVPIAIMSDNSRDVEMIPSNLSDFNLYGGLYRYINLKYVPAVSIEQVQIDVSFEDKKGAAVSIRAGLYDPAKIGGNINLTVEIIGPNGKSLHRRTIDRPVSVGMQDLVTFVIERPLLWSPAKPSLYKCAVTLDSPGGKHSVEERFGIRHFEFVRQGPFKLNGDRLFLRGTHRHEDHAGLAAALTEDLIRKEFRLMKEMGVNFIRLGHYQQSRIALDLCDELGFLVWEEIPWCRGGLGGERYREQARRMLSNMIDQHRNHPSVIIWGLGNENDWPGDFEEFDKEKIRAFMRELNDLSHKLDPSRKTAIRRCDFCKDVVDIYSPSIWAGWYSGRYTAYKQSSENEMKKVDHFLHVEYGGDSHAGRHAEAPDQIIAKVGAGGGTDERGLEYLLSGGVSRASSDGDWSETYICNLFDWHLKEQETMDWLTGAAQWVFKDFSTPLRPENPVPRVNQKGVVTRDLTTKEAYYVFQSYWSEKPMVHIYGHSWPTRWGAAGEPKMIKVYSNCPSVELFVNGVSLGEKKRSSQDFPAAGLRWRAVLKDGENTIRALGKMGRETIRDEIIQHYQSRPWEKPARLILESDGHDGGTLKIGARLVDQNGISCLDARDFVRFGATGDARLIDNLGTPDGSRKVQLLNGHAAISAKVYGSAVVSVAAAKLPTSFLKVDLPAVKKGETTGG
jgi:beta-galactosidase